jgi:hypothetical protein
LSRSARSSRPSFRRFPDFRKLPRGTRLQRRRAAGHERLVESAPIAEVNCVK